MGKHLVVLAGPTATGKTATGVLLAQYFGTEIISADSRQIYRETLIGTAVPGKELLETVRHHMVSVISVEQYYNASMYESDVLEILKYLFTRFDMVLLVGGSGLYIDAVCRGIDDLPAIDPGLREKLSTRLKKEGLKALTADLEKVDPISFQEIDLKNPMRVLKALEVSLQTGQPYSSFLRNKEKPRDFNIIRLALDMEREVLYDRINRRVDEMMKMGLLDEVKGLVPLKHCTALKTVGYRELFRYLDREISLDEAITQIKNNSRRYARKQLTWFRKHNLYRWFSPEDTDEMIAYIEASVNKSGK